MIREWWSDVRYLFGRANSKYIADHILPVFSLFMPIVLVTLFTQLFSGLANLPGFGRDSYLEFAVAGVLVMTTFGTALQSGASIIEDMDSGSLAKILTAPVKRSAIVFGRLFSDAVKVVYQAGIILLLGYFLGVTFGMGATGIVLILITVAIFGMAWSAVSLAFGLATRSSEAMTALPMVLTLPLVFTSTAFVPQSLLPAWMSAVSSVNPISYVADTLRGFLTADISLSTLDVTYGVLALVLVLGLLAALLHLRNLEA